MNLSSNFTLAELTKSSTADRRGIDNTPTEKEINKLKLLTTEVLQPVRDHFGPVKINSGFRCLKLNRAIGSRDTSQHLSGEAADIEVMGISNWELAYWIQDNLEFDQLILEFTCSREDYLNGQDAYDLNKGWVHISYKASGNRNTTLRINKDEGTVSGIGVPR